MVAFQKPITDHGRVTANMTRSAMSKAPRPPTDRAAVSSQSSPPSWPRRAEEQRLAPASEHGDGRRGCPRKAVEPVEHAGDGFPLVLGEGYSGLGAPSSPIGIAER